jgi:hypothetical protein
MSFAAQQTKAREKRIALYCMIANGLKVAAQSSCDICCEGPKCPHQRHRCNAQRRSASLIGCLGQARFPCFFWVIVAHPGHASLRSLVDALMAPLHAYVGSAVESPAFRRASRCAADIFGFIYYPTGHVYMPERAQTSSGEDDPARLGGWRFRSCRASHLVLTEFRAVCPHAVQ